MQERFNRAVYGNSSGCHHVAHAGRLSTKSRPRCSPNGTPRVTCRRTPFSESPATSRPAEVTQMFSALPGWKAGPDKAALPTATKPASGRKIFLVDRPGSVQTDVEIGNIAISRLDADYIPMVVMDRIVGGGASARLFMNLREVHGYTYGAYSMLVARRYAGPWMAQGSMRTDATGGAMTEFMNEINRIRDQAVPEKELEETKRSIVAELRPHAGAAERVAGLRHRAEGLQSAAPIIGTLIRPRSWPSPPNKCSAWRASTSCRTICRSSRWATRPS